MTGRPSEIDAATRAAMLCAAAMMAHQVGAKASRDALFLSSFTPRALPTMIVVSAVVSLAFVLVTMRGMTRLGPRRALPGAFVASALLLLVQWRLAEFAPRVTAVALYLQVASLGSVLLSGFWLLVSERFDPRAAKRRLAWIAGGGTVGSLLGGLAAERVGAWADPVSLLPVLAGLHLWCAWGIRRVSFPVDAAPEPSREERTRGGSTMRLLRSEPYLRTIAVFSVTGAVAAALVDYLFKTQAAAAYPTASDLLRFFALFYTSTSLLGLGIQGLLGRRSLEGLGVTRTASILPLTIVGGGLAAFVAPGLQSAVLLRGADAVLRGSLSRLASELLYTPLAPAERRATKALVDVGLDRLGDVLGGGLARVVVADPRVAGGWLPGVVTAVALLWLWRAMRLHGEYVRALERSLRSRAVRLDTLDVVDGTTRTTVLRTLGALPAREEAPTLIAVPVLGAAQAAEAGVVWLEGPPGPDASAAPGPAGDERRPPARQDPLLIRFQELRSRNPEVVRRALRSPPLDPSLVPQVIRLLAWDAVGEDAARALLPIAPKAAGQLVDALLDPDEEFAVRRRIPRVLGALGGTRVRDGLLAGLDDRRFEVRHACGRALARIRQRDGSGFDEARVLAAVLREVEIDRDVWESRRLLDPATTEALALTDDEPTPLGDLLRARGSLSLDHVFTLLSLVLSPEPLTICLRALHTDDAQLRGTAFEYLECVLPAAVRAGLWPFLDDDRGAAPAPRPRQEILQELLLSHSSIELRLIALRDRAKPGDDEDDG